MLFVTMVLLLLYIGNQAQAIKRKFKIHNKIKKFLINFNKISSVKFFTNKIMFVKFYKKKKINQIKTNN